MAWSYEEARALIEEQFAGYSPKMRDLARRAFADRWIDAGTRPGKVGGGFCMGLREEESRILVNYTPAFDGVSTLAHELGHAYHNLTLATRTMLQRSTPMTLAETASTFCETVIRQAGLARSSGQERLGYSRHRCRAIARSWWTSTAASSSSSGSSRRGRSASSRSGS